MWDMDKEISVFAEGPLIDCKGVCLETVICQQYELADVDVEGFCNLFTGLTQQIDR